MQRIAVTLVVLAAVLTLTSPAMAQGGSVTCQFLSQISEAVGGVGSGAVNNACGTQPAATPPASTPVASGGNPTVATPEPLLVLTVGLGLIGARMLRRR